MVKVSVSPLWYQKLSLLHYQRGLAFLQSMAYGQAIAAFEKAMRWHPHPSDVLVMRGVAYAKLGQAVAAFKDYEQALSLNPDHSRAYAKRGLLHDAQGNGDQAVQDWEQAIALGEEDAEIYYHRGLKAIERQQDATALMAFDRAIAINPNLAEAYFQRGNLRNRCGDLDGAMADWELAICNDFGQDDAKLRLQQARQHTEDTKLTEQLQAFFNRRSDLRLFSVQVRHVLQHRDSYLEVLVERPLGVGVNYQTLPNKIREGLIFLDLQDIYQFELVGRIQNNRFQDWKQRYGIYDQQPCPPRHWRLVLLMVIACPPLGLSSLLCTTQVVTLYKQGKYPLAQQASHLVKTLCTMGVGLSGFLVSLLLINSLFGGMRSPTSTPSQSQGQSSPVLSEFEQCLEKESRARCIIYRKKRPDDLAP